MTIKVATEQLRERMRRASANIAAGVRLEKPELELHGRTESAKAHIENQILLGRHYLTSEECQHLAELLFSTNDEDYTADAVETNGEALRLKLAPTTRLLDPDDEDLEGDED